MTMNPIELRQVGYQALLTELGPIDTVRFLQQAGWGTGDYSNERQRRLKAVSREQLWQDIHHLRATEDS